jgi:DNA-binding CsgD family transcriptional regulator
MARERSLRLARKERRLRKVEPRMKRISKGGTKRESVIDPALEKPLLCLHAAMNVGSFWKAIQQLLSVAVPNRLIGLTFEHNPGWPTNARWTRPMPDDFFAAEPLKSYLAQAPRKKFMRLGNLFCNRSSFVKSNLYRRYIAAQKCAHGFCLFFWKRKRLICVIAILRTVKQGDISPTEMKLLLQLYPQFLAALGRLGSLEREHLVRADFQEFLSRLPLPTIILRWNLKPIYQNRAAREFCAVWQKGPEEAKRTKATSPIPSEILDRCGAMKEQWVNAQPNRRLEPRTKLSVEEVHHPRLSHLRATIHLKQIKSAGVARPHFFIECEDLCRNSLAPARLVNSHLPTLARLTVREREVAQLACEGRSNKEIADAAHLSVAMVKKHIHAIFRKLEVPSRSRLVALML